MSRTSSPISQIAKASISTESAPRSASTVDVAIYAVPFAAVTVVADRQWLMPLFEFATQALHHESKSYTCLPLLSGRLAPGARSSGVGSATRGSRRRAWALISTEAQRSTLRPHGSSHLLSDRIPGVEGKNRTER